MATYIYCRLSKDEASKRSRVQVQNCKIQEALSREVCKQRNLGEPLVIPYDEGVSTWRKPFNKRPGIILLLSILQPGDHLVVWRLDRIERGFFTFFNALAQIEAKGVSIHAVEEYGGLPLDFSNAAGRARISISQIASDFYRETISDNTKRALAWRKACGVIYKKPYFGFKVVALPPVPGRTHRNANNVIVPVDVEIIHEIVRRRDRGETWYAITKDLMERDVRCDGRLWGRWTGGHGRRALEICKVQNAYRVWKEDFEGLKCAMTPTVVYPAGWEDAASSSEGGRSPEQGPSSPEQCEQPCLDPSPHA